MQRLVIILVLAGAAYFIFRVIMDYLSGISGTRSAARQDLLELDELLDVYELSEWDNDQVEILSRRYEVAQKSELHAYVDYGCFFSIFDEAIMAYAHKEYKQNDRELIVIAFHDKRFHFNIKGANVELTAKALPKGDVDLSDGLKIKMAGKTTHIDTNKTAGLIPVTVGSNEIFGIASEDELTHDAGRMLHKLREYTPEEGEMMKLAISFALANKQI